MWPCDVEVWLLKFCITFFRKEQLDLSVAQCWSVLLTQTRQESRDHSSLSELCSNTLTQRLSHCIEDTHRLAKRVKTSLSLSVMSSDFHPLSLLLLFTVVTYPHTTAPSSSFHNESLLSVSEQGGGAANAGRAIESHHRAADGGLATSFVANELNLCVCVL